MGSGQRSPHDADIGSRFKSGIESREHALGSVENLSDLLLLACERKHPTFKNREPGMCRRKWRNGLEPAVQSGHLARQEQQASMFLDTIGTGTATITFSRTCSTSISSV